MTVAATMTLADRIRSALRHLTSTLNRPVTAAEVIAHLGIDRKLVNANLTYLSRGNQGVKRVGKSASGDRSVKRAWLYDIDVSWDDDTAGTWTKNRDKDQPITTRVKEYLHSLPTLPDGRPMPATTALIRDALGIETKHVHDALERGHMAGWADRVSVAPSNRNGNEAHWIAVDRGKPGKADGRRAVDGSKGYRARMVPIPTRDPETGRGVQALSRRVKEAAAAMGVGVAVDADPFNGRKRDELGKRDERKRKSEEQRMEADRRLDERDIGRGWKLRSIEEWERRALMIVNGLGELDRGHLERERVREDVKKYRKEWRVLRRKMRRVG